MAKNWLIELYIPNEKEPRIDHVMGGDPEIDDKTNSAASRLVFSDDDGAIVAVYGWRYVIGFEEWLPIEGRKDD